MSWFGSASPPQTSPLLEGDITCSKMEFRKIWTNEEKYQLSHLNFVTCSDISRDWFYHDLKGVSLKPPLFKTDSIIGSCTFKRQHGETHEFHGLWEGEMKPNDTVSCPLGTFKNSITIRVEEKSELGQYVKDPSKSSEFKQYENKFIDKNEWISDEFAELDLQITKNEYYRRKTSDTIWAIHKIKIKKSVILSALESASIAKKPEIIEQYIEPQKEAKHQEIMPRKPKSEIERIRERMNKMEDKMQQIELKMNKKRKYDDIKNYAFPVLIAIGIWCFGKDQMTFWNFGAALVYAIIILAYFSCCYKPNK